MKLVTIEGVEVYCDPEMKRTPLVFIDDLFKRYNIAAVLTGMGPNGYPLFNLSGSIEALNMFDDEGYSGHLKEAYGLEAITPEPKIEETGKTCYVAFVKEIRDGKLKNIKLLGVFCDASPTICELEEKFPSGVFDCKCCRDVPYVREVSIMTVGG